MLMRGGTSKGAYFLAEDLPADPAERDDLLLRIMGSPDSRQIDGIGGAHPLTSKVAVISESVRPDADVDYLFLQVGVDRAMVSDRQNCGNLLAGVGPFAVERGLAATSPVRIHMVNSGSLATATFPAADGEVDYDGDTAIAGVPGTAAAIVLDFAGTEGSATGALLPTGNVTDVIDGVTVTCIDNGMPVVVVPAAEFGRSGYETVAELEADQALGQQVQALRLAAGRLMGLGDVLGGHGAEDLAGRGARGRRDDLHPDLHPGSRPRLDRGARRGERRDRAAARRRGRKRPGRRQAGAGPVRHRASHWPSRGRGRGRPGEPAARGDPLGRGAHRAQALRRHRLPTEVPVTSPQNHSGAAATRPPLHDVAHLGHIELLTPKLCESLWFFVEVLGMTETCREGNSIYLRTWDDYEHHTVKLTAHDTSGIRRVGLRASSQAALEARVAAIEATGLGIAWKDGDPGIGPTYLFHDPDGHELELYWESEWYAPPDELKPSLKNQAQAYPGRGVCVRRLDHVNYLAQDVPPNGEFVRDVLGGRVTEQIMLDDGTISAQWLHFTNKGYDLVYTRDWTGTTGRLHHVAFAPDTREDILRAADICLDHGVFIETGPHKHAIQQTFFLYVYEPGGNRIELCNPVARLVLAPDWRTITWTEAERAKGQAWGLKTIESFHTHGTPPVA